MFDKISAWLRVPRASDVSTFNCLVNHRLKLVYAYVPKAACSTVKMWLVREAGFAPDLAAAWSRKPNPQFHASGKVNLVPNLHEYLDRHYSLGRASAREVAAALLDPSYFRFTVVRNPLSRLVSAYLDKIVQAKRPAWALIARGQRALGVKPCTQSLLDCLCRRTALNPARSLTFREFVGQLTREDAARLNPHFAPQAHLLRGIALDYVARAENLAADFHAVQTRLACRAPLANQNTRDYAANLPTECAANSPADWPAASFRAQSAAPAWPHFYDEALLSEVARIYRGDFEQFGYACALPDQTPQPKQAFLPLPLGEGRGEGLEAPCAGVSRVAEVKDPHLNPLPKGEGAGEATSSLARQSPLPAGPTRAEQHRNSLRRQTSSASA